MSFAANSTTRRQFVKEISFGVWGPAVAESMSAWAAADETKHSHLIKKIVYNMKEMWRMVGPGNADLIWWPKGPDLENKKVNFSFGNYTKMGDQFLVFAGLDNKKPDYLGAEIEITLEDEKHTFNCPSCVIIPAGMQHGPIVTRSVETPYGMYMVRLDKGDPSDINPA